MGSASGFDAPGLSQDRSLNLTRLRFLIPIEQQLADLAEFSGSMTFKVTLAEVCLSMLSSIFN
jgi:hypothetical protein